MGADVSMSLKTRVNLSQFHDSYLFPIAGFLAQHLGRSIARRSTPRAERGKVDLRVSDLQEQACCAGHLQGSGELHE